MVKLSYPRGGLMGLSVQTLIPGSLQTAYQRELDDLIATDAIARLWAKVPSLWPSGEGAQKILTNLAWLDLPDRIGKQMADVSVAAAAAELEGFEDVVFVGMGDSNLAAQTILSFPAKKRWKRLFVLDSTDPATIAAVENQLDFQRTLFVFASKSGKHIEAHSLLLYFLQRLKAQGISSPGNHFIAVTEDGSYLSELAISYKFRALSFDPPGIKGRYSALIHFGLLLSALCRLDPATLSAYAKQMRDACRQPMPHANPALSLAAFLAAAAIEGHDRFLLLSAKTLAPFTYCVGQLVGVSMDKGGRGLIPIGGSAPSLVETCRPGCITAIFTLRGELDPALQEALRQLKQTGTPTLLVELNAPEELGAELFKWEIATALACSLLKAHPFIEPDCQDGKQKTAEFLETLLAKHELPSRTIRVREAAVELYAEGETRQEISTLNLFEAVRTFLELKDPGGYLAILAFLDQSPAVESVLESLRERLASRLGIPVLLSWGPRYLHCFGQVYKGGPPKGLFLMLTSEPGEDIDIPGAGYSFGQLHLALALGDFETLVSRKKPVVRLHLAPGLEPALAQLTQVVAKL
jgi:transaldolase / glucose-6-phosphate isomerase